MASCRQCKSNSASARQLCGLAPVSFRNSDRVAAKGAARAYLQARATATASGGCWCIGARAHPQLVEAEEADPFGLAHQDFSCAGRPTWCCFAMANKTARIAWAMLSRGERYQEQVVCQAAAGASGSCTNGIGEGDDDVMAKTGRNRDPAKTSRLCPSVKARYTA